MAEIGDGLGATGEGRNKEVPKDLILALGHQCLHLHRTPLSQSAMVGEQTEASPLYCVTSQSMKRSSCWSGVASFAMVEAQIDNRLFQTKHARPTYVQGDRVPCGCIERLIEGILKRSINVYTKVE